MSFFDILHLALRNLRQAKLRAVLTTMGVVVGVAVIVTMMSFGLGLERASRGPEGERRNDRRSDRSPTRILDDKGIKEIAAISGVAYVEPSVSLNVFVRSNGKLRSSNVGGANIPNAATRFQHFAAGKMISSPTAGEAVVSERFLRDFGYEKPADAVGKTIELLAPPSENKRDKSDAEEE